MNSYVKQTLWLIPFISFIFGYIALDRWYKPKNIITPNIIGLPLIQGLKILAQNNLNARVMALKEDETLAPETIIHQTPNPTLKIKENQLVFLVVSSQPQVPKAPDCIGKNLDTIEKELAPTHIRIKSYFIPSVYPKNCCFAQYPPVKQDISDNTIIVYISAGNDQLFLMPNFTKKSVTKVLDHLSTYSTINTQVYHDYHVDADHACTNCIIVDQRPMPGTAIKFDTKKPLHIQFQVR